MENSDQFNGQKVINSQIGKTMAEIALRLYKLERVVNYIYLNNQHLNLPSEQELLKMNLEAVEETKLIPGVHWTPEQ